MIASLLGLSLVGTVALWVWAIVMMPDPASTNVIAASVYVLSGLGLELFVGLGLLAGVLAIFVFVSRRFEWQADAFAAMHLSMPGALGEVADASGAGGKEEESGARVISAAGVAAMSSALAAVSELNHIPLDRGSMRHGSLELRIRKLNRLVGVPLDAVPIDRTVRRIKVVTAVCGLGVGALMAAAMWWGY
jgi:Zn-dependent protease with chaperone function